MTKTILIGLGHKAQIGKDYAAAQLAKHFDVERIAFADALKDDLTIIFEKQGIDLKAIMNDPTLKHLVRPLLVEYGCTVRKFKPDQWVDRAFQDKQLTHEITVVTDVRFPNEAKRLKEYGGYYVDIIADVPPANETERACGIEMVKLADFTIENKFDGSYVENLINLIYQIKAKHERIKRPNSTS